MTPTRWLFFALLALPLIIAAFDLGLVAALVLVIVWLFARWAATLADFLKPRTTGLHLDTIAASHFVEKVRWCLDRARIPYTEHQSVGSLGAFFTGRSVPRLRAGTGLVTTSIGNSPEILRYLWGNYGHEEPELRAFLEPTPERVTMEKTLDRYGYHLQVWVYAHLLDSPAALAKAWGVHDSGTPVYQRVVAQVISPLLRAMMRKSFRIYPANVAKSRGHIEQLLTTTETRLADANCLVGNQRSYVDYTFAALSGLWLQPAQYGNGKAEGVRLHAHECPQTMQDDMTDWRRQFPRTVSFLEHLYENERSGDSRAAGPEDGPGNNPDQKPDRSPSNTSRQDTHS